MRVCMCVYACVYVRCRLYVRCVVMEPYWDITAQEETVQKSSVQERKQSIKRGRCVKQDQHVCGMNNEKGTNKKGTIKQAGKCQRQ